ncbi:L,D-transpeptidase family protein [Marmoricola sp. RAF53]|uniref:L,D-transpeptidase family protein n=1 Tax=Marmoricola sp. RAF53 TaxID=3233059 RepID=UPI003F95E9A1
MTRLTVLALALACVVALAWVPATAADLRLDGVLVRLPAGSTQVVTVNRTSGTHARVSFWERRPDGWKRLALSRAARIGYGGLVSPTRRRQGSGTTPLGTYRLLSSFGTGERRASWDLGYVRIRPGYYWVQDNASRFYNRMRDKALGGFRWWLDPRTENGSERLAAYPVEYAMSVVIGFNYAHPVRHRGSGIFLHVNGRGATAGCVSAPRAFLARTMTLLDPVRRPVIAIGR